MPALPMRCIYIGLLCTPCLLQLPTSHALAQTPDAQAPGAEGAPPSDSPVEQAAPDAGASEADAAPPADAVDSSVPEPPAAVAPEVMDPAAAEIVVTGTRRSSRTVTDSNVPIDVVKTNDMKSSPSPDLNDKLSQSVPSFKIERQPVFDGATFNRPATLRGLSPDQTLVLINGKRRHRSAYIDVMNQGAQAVDLAQIPMIAIKRIEVLRDGASAQYGSDAIAGVINIILEDTPGYRGYAQYSRYYAGDGNAAVAAAAGGWELGDRGSLNLSLEGLFGEATSRSTQRPDAAALIAAGNTAVRQPVAQRWGQPDLLGVAAFLNADYRLSDAVELYAFGNFGYRWGETDFYYRNPTLSTVFTSPQEGTTFDMNFAMLDQRYRDYYLNNPAGAVGYPGGFTPFFSMGTIDGSVVAGARGNLTDDLSWDLSGRFGQNTIDYHIRNTLNASLGPDSPKAFDPGAKRQTELAANLDFAYLWDVGLEEPLNIAVGGEVRREEYEAGLGDPGSYAVGPLSVIGLAGGSNGYFGTGPTQTGTWDQGSVAAYIDVDADITRWLNLAAAARIESFFEVGTTGDYKFAGRIEPIENFSVRGAVSTGFRAATPGQQNLTNTRQAPSADGTVIETTGTIPPNNAIAMLKGGTQLTPEKSLNLSVGFVAQPLKKLTLSVDYYRINVRDRITLSQRYTLTPEEQQSLVDLGVEAARGLTQFNFYVNGYETLTQGIDAVLSFRFDLTPASYLHLTGTANLNRTEVVASNPGVISAFNRQFIEDRLPKHVENIALEYRIGPLSIVFRARHYGPWTEPFSDETDAEGRLIYNEGFDAETFFDLLAAYAFLPNVRLNVGAENIFNNYPNKARFPNSPEDAAAGAVTDIGRVYPTILPYDADGGRLYARLDVEF